MIIGVSLAVIFGGVDLRGVYPAKDHVAVIYVRGVMITGGLPDRYSGYGFQAALMHSLKEESEAWQSQ
jgi:hypothetical protein